MNEKIGVVSIYRPPSGNYQTFFAQLEKIITYFLANSITLYIGGDFNINLFHRTNSNVQAFIDLIESYDLTFSNNSPTRYAALLDNFICQKNITNRSSILKSLLADHDAVFLGITLKNNNTDSHKIINKTKREFSEANRDKLSQLVNSESWEGIYHTCDVDEKLEKFTTTLFKYYT